ncbi:MAG: MlaD family protein, partial [Bryobacteraceae bacterium]
MPDEHKVRWAGLRVGIMAIVALIIAGGLIYLLSGTHGFFKSTSQVYVYMDDSSDMARGAPVRLNGILIGSVGSVALSGSDQPNRVVRITLNIDDKYMGQIPVDSKAQIAQPNLLGTRYINITKGTSPRTIQPGGELQNAETTELTDLFQQGNTARAALKEILKIMDDVLSAVQTGQGTIGKFLVDPTLYDKAVVVVNEGQKLIATLNSN